MTTYLIIGNGAAGNTAAEAIRKHDQEGTVHIFSKEKYPFYYVPALPDFLAGEKQLSQFTIHHHDWYEKNRIDLHLDTAVTRIDPDRKLLETRQGDRYNYDKLLLATGSYSFVPPIKGGRRRGSTPSAPLTTPGPSDNGPKNPGGPCSSAGGFWDWRPATVSVRQVCR